LQLSDPAADLMSALEAFQMCGCNVIKASLSD